MASAWLVQWRRGTACLLGILAVYGAPVIVYALSKPVSPLASAAAKPERWALLADTVFHNFSDADGLPNMAATSLAQDGDGFLWIGTQGGLARWDGYRFHNYFPDPHDQGALPEAYLRVLHTDKQGRLWIGASSAGLARYEPQDDRFVRIPIGPKGISSGAIRAIADDGAGGLWVGTGAGLNRFNPATGAVEVLRHDANDPSSLPHDGIASLLVDRSGALWVGTRQGLVYRPGNVKGNGGFIPVRLSATNAGQPVATRLLQARDGRVWVGTMKHGVFVVAPTDRTATAIAETEATKWQPISETVPALAEMPSGEIWLGTYGQGIVAVDGKSLRTRRIVHDARMPTSLVNDSVTALFFDQSGLLWTATERGLGRHNPQTAVLTLFGDASRTGSLSDPEVTAAMSAPDGRVWLGLQNGGVDIIDPVGGTVTNLRPGANDASRSTENSVPAVGAITSAEDGLIYVGTRRGLYRADSAGRSLIRPPAWSQDEVPVLLADGKHLWVGGQGGLWERDLGDDVGALAARVPWLKHLTDERIAAIGHAAEGGFWIGSFNGLNLYKPDTQDIEKIPAAPSDQQALSAGLVASLLTDSKKRLWVGTFDGLNLLVGRDAQGRPRFRRFGVRDGLPNSVVNKVLEDAEGNIWISTDAGIARIDGKTFAVRALRSADGLAIPSYWVTAGAATPQGELLFGGGGGVTIVRPDRYKEWAFRPPVVVTDARLGGKPVRASRFNDGLQAKADPLVVTPDANSIAIEFSALDYSAPERNRYAYRLDGFDKDWVETDPTRRLAAYTNLPPGDYRLRLRGSNREGVWTEHELQVPIHVLPAWYQTWWMHLIELLAAAAAIYAFVQARTRYLRQRQRELESQVQQRTAELALSAETLRQLGEVGRDITANLDAAAVFDALHRHVVDMLDAAAMIIYRIDSSGNALEPVFAREDGRPVRGLLTIPLDSPESNMAKAARERREILLEVAADRVHPAHVPHTRHMLTSLFAPLVVDERLLGVMSVQSPRVHAYGDRERLIFRSLCAYGGIALDNASTYRQLEATLRTLSRTQTELLERNQELAYANALQEQHQSELTRFLAVASHDLRQPMHALNLYLGALSNFELPTSARPVLGNVRQCAQIMDDMFLALLDLSRLDAQVVEPHIEAFPMASLLSSIAVEFAPQARAKGLQLRVARCAAWVRSDTALVEQILRNLVANAVRYTDTGGILVGCRRRGDQLRLAVIDTGIGITADQHKAVFEEFCQLGNEGHDRTKGLGLGLAIVRRLARLLHTPITLVSEPGRGSMFAIDLPLGQAANTVAAAEPLAPATVVDDDHAALSGKTVVVVDDEDSILDAMRILLEQWGCLVVSAKSAQDAVAQLGSCARVPDVLVCDYRLHLHETGLDAITTIQGEFNCDIPALIITGTVTQERMQELAATSMPVLHKPVSAAVLHAALVRIFSGTQADRHQP